MNHSEIKLPKNVISDSAFYSMTSYDSLPTKFMNGAWNAVQKSDQGWGMLVEQAAESYYLWKKSKT